MSCPDWTRLAHDEEPVSAAMWAHAEGCDACRETALNADPTLVFRRLPRVDASPEDIAHMQHAVAAMRRAKTVEDQAGPQRELVVPRAPRRVAPLFQTIGLAAAALIAVLLPARFSTVADTVPDTVADAVPAVVAQTARVPADSTQHDDTAWLRAQLANELPMESAAGLEVIQIASDEVDLVVVVANNTEVTSLDV